MIEILTSDHSKSIVKRRKRVIIKTGKDPIAQDHHKVELKRKINQRIKKERNKKRKEGKEVLQARVIERKRRNIGQKSLDQDLGQDKN